MTTTEIVPLGRGRWIKLSERPVDSVIRARCRREALQKAVGSLGAATVVAANVNFSGRYDVPPPIMPLALPLPFMSVIEGLPEFCDVTINLRGAGGHVSTITVWVPLNWNGRFLGTAGAGNRTEGSLGMPEIGRALNIATALRNGFATAKTDGGNKDQRIVEWGLKDGTREIDWELTQNWIHRSTHEMTVVGKAVTEAIHGAAPKYSYLAGCSGGGRQVLMEAQRYPEDYDGLWAADPAINWTKFVPAELWPALVMKESGVIVPPVKLNAFRAAAIAACDGLDGLRDGIVGAFDPCDFDPKTLVGHSTEAGPITEMDANVMAKIWQGPRTQSGDFLWYGIPPSSDGWGTDFMPGGVCASVIRDDKRELVPFLIAEGYLRAWVAKDQNWDWRTMTFADFERMFDRSVRELSELATDNPDLTAFRDHGGKIIISHGANDALIPALGTVDYYRRVIDTIGSEVETKSFARLFIAEGDGHGGALDGAPGLNTTEVMVALMKWVENGERPDEIIAQSVDLFSGVTKGERPAYAYPFVPQYRGEGDPNRASSFAPVHLSQRVRK